MKTLTLSLLLLQVILVNAQTYEWVNSPEFISDEFELTDIAIDNEGNILQAAGYENSFVIGTTQIELNIDLLSSTLGISTTEFQ